MCGAPPGRIKHSSMVSIITVSWNARDTIGDCLASVAAQSARPEHVIVDGASTDGTLAMLRGWTGHQLEIVSEPDHGIYDAMNKGIAAYIPSVLVRMRAGGVSNVSLRNRWRANRMDRKAWRVNGLRPYLVTRWLKTIVVGPRQVVGLVKVASF
jgi:glycosyltransferase involved in cell wall biosynthesis